MDWCLRGERQKKEAYDERGFTLIELLIAIAIMSIVVSVLAQAFWLAHRSMEKGTELMDFELRERIAFDLISKQLSSAFPHPLRDDAASFVGSARSIHFITTLPMGIERKAGLFYVNYVLEESPAGELKMIKVYQKPYYSKELPAAAGEMSGFTVLSSIEDAAWAYYVDGEWIDEYEGEDGMLPEKIRLTLTYGSDERKEKLQVRRVIIPVIAEARRRALIAIERREA